MTNTKLRHFFISSLLLFTLCACNNGGGDIMKLVEERDSLRSENEKTAKQLKAINKMVATLNSALDSIAFEEEMLFVSRSPEMQLSRDDAMKNLERFEEIVRHQQERINKLEASLKGNGSNANLEGLVNHLKEQIADKDKQIAQLRSQLQSKDVNIAQLKRHMENQRTQLRQQSEQIAELDRRTKSQTEALKRQDEVINNCYVLLGTKKDLKRKGIIKKGLLVSEALIDKSQFTKVDIRKSREMTFEAKRPRILTNMPQSSYSLTSASAGTFTLYITNPTEFWSISNYLVIQTD